MGQEREREIYIYKVTGDVVAVNAVDISYSLVSQRQFLQPVDIAAS